MKRLVLFALLLSSPVALAKKGVSGGDEDGNIRLTISTPIYVHDKYTEVYTGGDDDVTGSDTISGIALGTGGSPATGLFLPTGARLQGGYMIRPGIEVGASLQLSQLKNKEKYDDGDNEEDETSDPFGIRGIQFYGGYNYGLSGPFVAYGEAQLGLIHTFDDEYESTVNWAVYGLDAGIRYKVTDHGSINLALQYLGGRVTKAEVDGDDVIEDTTVKASNIELRTGFSLKF